MILKTLRIIAAVAWAASLAACSESAEPRVLPVGKTTGEGSGHGRLFVSVLPDDLMLETYWHDHHQGRDATSFEIRANGAWLVTEIWNQEWEKEYDYVEVIEGSTIEAAIPAGTYAFEIVDGDETVVQTIPVTISENVDVMLLVYGSPDSFEHHLFVDDYAGIPEHMTRLRVVNTFDTREDVDVVACPNEMRSYGDCEIIHEDLEYGQVFEQLVPVHGSYAAEEAGILRDPPPGFESPYDVIAMTLTPGEGGIVSSIFPWHQYAAENEPCPFCATLVIIDSTVLVEP